MSGNKNVVLVAVGPDRVGLVETVSEFIVENGCNIEDSRMAVFAGEFAMIFLLSGKPEDIERLEKNQDRLGDKAGLTIWVKEPAPRKTVEGKKYRLTASCLDHTGIVYRLSHLLSKSQINIESMDTQTYQAPDSGTQMFRMEAIVTVPFSTDLGSLKQKLIQMEKEENIDIRLSEIR